MTRKQKCLAALVFLDVLLPIGCGYGTPGTATFEPGLSSYGHADDVDQHIRLTRIEEKLNRIESRLDDLLREADTSAEEGPR